MAIKITQVKLIPAGLKIEVHDTVSATKGIRAMKGFLKSQWCQCKESEFLCYPEDGACICGVYKHHVHCANCGGVSQVG